MINKKTLYVLVCSALLSPFVLTGLAQLSWAQGPGQSATPTKKKAKKKTPTPLVEESEVRSEPHSASEVKAVVANSEFFQQAGHKELQLTPSLAYEIYSVNYRKLDSPKSADSKNLRLSGRLEYGLMQDLAIGAGWGYLSGSTEFTPNNLTDAAQKGFTNFEIYGKGRHRLNVGTAFFGANLSATLDKRRVGSDNSQNGYTGGNTFTPYLGYEFPLDVGGIVGGKFDYEIYKGPSTIEYTSSGGKVTRAKEKNGEQLSLTAFYERPIQTHTLGAAVTYLSKAKTKTDIDTETTQDDNAYDGVVLKAYGVLNAAPNFTLLPSLSYGTPSNLYSYPLYAYVQDGAGWRVELAGRTTF